MVSLSSSPLAMRDRDRGTTKSAGTLIAEAAFP
jgi:hypothetical protein